MKPLTSFLHQYSSPLCFYFSEYSIDYAKKTENWTVQTPQVISKSMSEKIGQIKRLIKTLGEDDPSEDD